jgi:hypothetical protein
MTAKRVTNAVLLERIDNVKETVDKIDKCLYGNDNPGKGLVTRVDRIEQLAKAAWVGIGAGVVVIVEKVVQLF